MARPTVEFDWVRFDSYLQLRATKRQCAYLLGVSEKTIDRRVNQEKDMTFTEYAEAKFTGIKLKLVQKIVSKALDGDNTCLIFSLKNLCGWADKVESESTEAVEVFVTKYED
jgi:hypothetical protein